MCVRVCGCLCGCLCGCVATRACSLFLPSLACCTGRYDKSKVINGTANHAFTNVSEVAIGDEDQLAAWIFAHGPVNTGVASDVFGLREPGCEADESCFITPTMCANNTEVGAAE